MTIREVAIYASLHCDNLDDIESSLAAVIDKGGFRRIEQRTVLLYQDPTLELSIDRHNESIYLSGRYKAGVQDATSLLRKMVAAFAKQGVVVSIDYQEEDEEGNATSQCFTVATDAKPTQL